MGQAKRSCKYFETCGSDLNCRRCTGFERKELMTTPQRTFRLDRLYFQFLKPKGLPIEDLQILSGLLVEAGFINMEDDLERYSETEKLTSRQHRDELFKIIQGLI
jgi:hypothetical protein